MTNTVDPLGGMRELETLRDFFASVTLTAVVDLPFIVIFLALVASIGGNLVWILVAGGILMVLPGFLFQKKMVALTAATQGASTRAARLLYEAIFEAETVTTQRGEDRVKRIWQELSTLSAAKSSDQRHLTANREITDVSELRLLLEMEEADYRRLLPFVSALPSEALLNVNTASAEVLAALLPGLDLEAARALVASRERAIFLDRTGFLTRLPEGLRLAPERFSVNSDYFLVTLSVELHGAQARGSAA